jgi:hypothetical protein
VQDIAEILWDAIESETHGAPPETAKFSTGI